MENPWKADDGHLLTAEEWEQITEKLRGRLGARARGHKSNARSFIEAVLWIARSGAYWRCLPKDFGPSHSVYVRFSRWVRGNRWGDVLDCLPTRDPRAVALAQLVAAHAASLDRKRAYSAVAMEASAEASPQSEALHEIEVLDSAA